MFKPKVKFSTESVTVEPIKKQSYKDEELRSLERLLNGHKLEPELFQVFELISKQYRRDKETRFIEKPIAHSLHEVWKYYDKKEESRLHD